jgi:hypothetical protein
MNTPCGITAEQLTKIPDNEKVFVRAMIAIPSVQDMISQKLCNAGAQYMPNLLFLYVQWNSHKIRSPNTVYSEFKVAAMRVWKMLDKTLQDEWKAAAAELKAMDRTTG